MVGLEPKANTTTRYITIPKATIAPPINLKQSYFGAAD
jgi:hypothetical protein